MGTVMVAPGSRPGVRRAARRVAVFIGIIALTACSAPTTPVDATPQRYIEGPTISAEAEQAYGDRAEIAYRELAEFSLDEWLIPEVIDPQTPEPTVEQLITGITPHLTATTVTRWEESVTTAVGGDTAAQEDVSILRLYTLNAPTLRLPGDGKPTSSQSIVDGTVSLGTAEDDGVVPLVVSFTQNAELELRRSRAPVEISLVKTVEFTVVPAETETATTTATTQPEEVATFTTEAAQTPATIAPADPETPDTPATWLIAEFEGDITADEDSTEATHAPTG